MAGGPTSFSRFPSGLLDLLQSKHLGTAPNELNDIVSPGVDMFQFWTRELVTTTSEGGTVQNVGDGLFATVPQGEVWIPLSVAANVVAGNTADNCRYSFLLRLPGTAVSARFHTSPNLAATASGDFLQDSYELQNRVWIPPDGFIGFSLDETGLLAARTASLAMLYIAITL